MNIFGGNTGMTYEELQRRQAMADRLRQQNASSTPRNVGEGVHAIARALVARGVGRQASEREKELKTEADAQWAAIFGGDPVMGSSGTASNAGRNAAMADNGGPTVAAANAMEEGSFEAAKPRIFAGESGGDYNALYGYSNRDRYAGVQPTNMSVGDVLKFQDPNGDYGQWVKGKVGRVATPVGAYQVVGSTLRDAVKAGVVAPDEQFSPEVQDRVGKWIFSTQGTGAWEGYDGAPAGGGGRNAPNTQAIVAAMSNPMIQRDPGRMAVLNAMLGQSMERSDPMKALEMQKMQLELAQMQDPSSSREYGLTPQYVTRPDGSLGMVQLSKDGTAKEVDLPEGMALQKGVQKLDLGTHFQWYNNVTGEPIGEPIKKDLAGAARETAAGTEAAKAEAEASKELREIERNMPGLLTVVDQLDALAEAATYTMSGQAYNEARKQMGLEPTEGAIARAEYIAVVDNQVLPLLRQTFGAAFTAKEGDTLRNTLGDPNKSPQEKKAVLRSFIAQKKRDLEARGGTVEADQATAGQSSQTFEEFAADPTAKAAADRYGVTLEEMWAIKQGQQ